MSIMMEVGGRSLFGPISTASAHFPHTADEVSDWSAVDTGSETMVQQAFRDEVDINTILKRFGAGIVPIFGSKQAMYGDFTDIEDFDSAVAKVDSLRAQFMMLPPELRQKFDHDVGRFVDFVKDMSQEEFGKLVEQAMPPVVDTGAAGTAAP